MGKDRILVTGGAGYIGSLLVRSLLDKGHRVRVLDNFTFGIEPLKEFINHPNIEIIHGDIRNSEDIKKSLKGVGSVVHLAAIVGDSACDIQRDHAVEVNFSSTVRLAQLSKESNVKRFVFASSCSVYGTNSRGIIDETSLPNPLSLYSETKLNAEKKLLELFEGEQVLAILRFGTAYGLSPRMRFDLVVNHLTKKALQDKEIKIFGGEQCRPFIHVMDIVRSVNVILDAPSESVSSQVFNGVSTESNYMMKDIGQMIKQCVPGTNVNIVDEIKDKKSYHVSGDKIKEKLGFSTQVAILEGVMEMRDAIETGKIRDVTNPIYYNNRVQF